MVILVYTALNIYFMRNLKALMVQNDFPGFDGAEFIHFNDS